MNLSSFPTALSGFLPIDFALFIRGFDSGTCASLRPPSEIRVEETGGSILLAVR
jgi:hypothetical protein